MKKILLVVVFLLIAAPVWGATYTINASVVHQSIDGFGAASMGVEGYYGPLSSAQADMFFSASTGIGLSLLRSRVYPDGSIDSLSISQQAVARGAKVWATPLSPPAAWKSSGSTIGGYLLPAHYQDFANLLANYTVTMNSNGVSVYAVSIQNEPDYDTGGAYDWTSWSADQFHAFIPYLYSALSAAGMGSVKIMLPESDTWDFSLASTTMADSTTAAEVGILAAHGYWYDNPTTPPTNYAKPIWQTEDSDLLGSYDGSITSALTYATIIHKYLALANVNAWHYWWLIPYPSSSPVNNGLTDSSGNPAKRMYALGQFSKFIRPGWKRIDVSGSGDVLVSAYADPDSGNFAIVAINPDSSPQSTTFSLSGLSVTTVTPWITSASLSLASQTAVSVSGSAFTYSLPASSITTFQGQRVLLSPPLNLHIIAQ